MDITLSLLPWKLLWGLQMKKKEKIGVITAMSMGLVYVGPIQSASRFRLTKHCLHSGLPRPPSSSVRSSRRCFPWTCVSRSPGMRGRTSSG